jgi:hypothetical protein
VVGDIDCIVAGNPNTAMWVFQHFASAGDPPDITFSFDVDTHVRGGVAAYRGVNTTAPIQHKEGYSLCGNSSTNWGGGSVTNTNVAVIHLSSTGVSASWTYVDLSADAHLNTGEQENGLNIVFSQAELIGLYFVGPGLRHRASPQGTLTNVLFQLFTFTLSPR